MLADALGAWMKVWKWKPNEWKSTSQRIIHNVHDTNVGHIGYAKIQFSWHRVSTEQAPPCACTQFVCVCSSMRKSTADVFSFMSIVCVFWGFFDAHFFALQETLFCQMQTQSHFCEKRENSCIFVHQYCAKQKCQIEYTADLHKNGKIEWKRGRNFRLAHLQLCVEQWEMCREIKCVWFCPAGI